MLPKTCGQQSIEGQGFCHLYSLLVVVLQCYPAVLFGLSFVSLLYWKKQRRSTRKTVVIGKVDANEAVTLNSS